MKSLSLRRFAAAVVLGTAAVSAFAPSHAADARGDFAVKGVGLAPCVDVAKAIEEQSPLFLQMGGWIAGYLSALNQKTPETFDLFSWQDDVTVAGAVLSWCRANPSARLFEAAAAMAKSLEADRLRERSALIAIPGSEPPLRLYAETLRRAQEALARFGFDPGERGTFGEATRAAVLRYQAKTGLPQTGLPDRDTLYALLAPGSAARAATAR
jgi:hypothetical protein